MSYVDPIIAAFGGVRPMAAHTGYPPSTVQSWKDRNSIPDVHKAAILSVARKLGLALSEVDFFPHADRDAAQPGEAAA